MEDTDIQGVLASHTAELTEAGLEHLVMMMNILILL